MPLRFGVVNVPFSFVTSSLYILFVLSGFSVIVGEKPLSPFSPLGKTPAFLVEPSDSSTIRLFVVVSIETPTTETPSFTTKLFSIMLPSVAVQERITSLPPVTGVTDLTVHGAPFNAPIPITVSFVYRLAAARVAISICNSPFLL